MIAPMKKATVIVQAKDAHLAVKGLRSLGVLHVEYMQAPQGQDINLLQEDLALLNGCFNIFSQVQAKERASPSGAKLSGDWKSQARHIIELWKHHDQLESYSRSLSGTISAWEKWGDFDPQQIEGLAQKGVYLSFYQAPEDGLSEFPAAVALKKIYRSGGIAYCLAIAREKFECPFQEIALPKQGLVRMRQRLGEDKELMAAIRNEIIAAGAYYSDFLVVKQKLEKEIEFQQVLSGMGREGAFAYVSGFLPAARIGELSQSARDKSWGMVIDDPAAGDLVPTLIINPRWVSLIRPLFKLLEVYPGYHELDISRLFLIFFSIFFGILIGDAGYGLVYGLLAFWVHKTIGRRLSDKRVFSLFYLLGSCAIIWGALTGTFFGQQWCARLGLRPLVPALNDDKFMQAFCFFLGALHLSLAHSWRAALKFPSLAALSDIGWICVLWSAFFFAKTLILGDALAGFVKAMLFSGMALVVLFTNPQKNIFKGIGEGLGTLALSLMNNFTDVVSYVRLFAVGMASLAIAETCNAMAAGVTNGTALMAVAGGLIIIVGHSLNVLLGPVSVLVHGVRLNVLEFSGHANLTWSGVAYKPLSE